MENASLETRLAAIEARNARVENDKRWETSLVRKMSVAVLTYLTMCSYMYVIGQSAPFLSATIPTLGFLLSTFALQGVRSAFEKSGNGGGVLPTEPVTPFSKTGKPKKKA